MARQGKIRLRGTFGKIIYYDWNDIPCMRLKNDHCNQTTKTKARAKTFGIGSKVGNKIINEFKAVIPALMTNHSRNDFVTHLNAWLYTDPLNITALLDDVPFITGFQFNEQTSLNVRLKLALSVTRTIDNTLLLSIPAFDPVKVISSPANTVAVELYIVACSCNMNNPDSGVEKFSTKMEIDYVSKQLPAQQLELAVKAEQDNIAVVMIALKYTINKKGNLFEINDKRWMPAGIVSAIYN